jgi:hypothetical protein
MRKICLVVLLTLALVPLCGCFASFNTLYAPSVGITRSVLPEYDGYVKADANLTPADKDIRLNNSKMFRKLIEEYGK